MEYGQKKIGGVFIMISVITNIYNNTTKRPTLMDLFISAGELKNFC
jgi:hypothetical protein